jgi:hypothetical protein
MDAEDRDRRITIIQAVFRDQLTTLCRIIRERDSEQLDPRSLQLLEILLAHGAQLARELQGCLGTRKASTN